MKKWTTTFCLTKGIIQVDITGQTVLDCWELPEPIDYCYRLNKKECFDNYGDALKRAKVLKARAIRQKRAELKAIIDIEFLEPHPQQITKH